MFFVGIFSLILLWNIVYENERIETYMNIFRLQISEYIKV